MHEDKLILHVSGKKMFSYVASVSFEFEDERLNYLSSRRYRRVCMNDVLLGGRAQAALLLTHVHHLQQL